MKVHRDRRCRYISVLLILSALFLLVSCAGRGEGQGRSADRGALRDETAAAVLEDTPEASVSTTGGDWAVKGLAESGIELPEGYFDRYYDNVCAEVQTTAGVLSEVRYTEYERVCIGLAAVGRDPRSVAGCDIFAPLDDYDRVTGQGINAVSYALIAGRECGISLKNEEAYLSYITEELGRGGYYDREMSSDYVSMALQALALYRGRREADEAIQRCLDSLSGIQKDDGSLGNCESTAQCILALTALGIDPLGDSRFIKKGGTLLDGLDLYREEGGRYRHVAGGKADRMATEQALMALNACLAFADGTDS